MSIVLALLTVAIPTDIAVTADNRRTIAVASSDLDLSSPTGVRRLNTRVRLAVERVCAVSGRSIEEMTWRAGCRTEAVASARPKVDSLVAAARSSGAVQVVAR